MVTLAGFLLGSLLLVALGLSVRDGVLLALAVSVQAATGAWVWARVGTSTSRSGASGHAPDVLELLGMGLALGSVMALLSGVALNAVVPWDWWWLAPSGVVLIVAVISRRPLAAVGSVRGLLGPALFGLGLGILGVWLNLQRYPLQWSGSWDRYHNDMVFFEALGTGVARFGANDSIFMTGAPFRYHWFSYAWVGQLTDWSGAVPFAALTRVLPLVALLGTVALAVSWSRRLIASRSAAYLAAALIAFGGYVAALNGIILNFDSPSQAMTTLWLMGFVFASLQIVASFGVWAYLPAGLFAVAMTGGKVSAAITAIGGVGLVALVGLLRREAWRWRAVVLLMVSLVLTAATFLLVLAGNASSGDLKVLSLDDRASTVQGLNSSLGPRGVVIGSVVLIAAIAARWMGATALLADRSWRWRPDVVLGLGMGAVGVLAIAVLSQGVNETWFALAASTPLSVLSAVGLAGAWQRVQDRQALIWALVVGLLVTPIIAVAWARGWPGFLIIRFWAPVTAYAIAVGLAVILGLRRGRWSALAAFATVLVIASSMARVLPSVAGAWTDVAGRVFTGPTVVSEASTEPVTDLPTSAAVTAADSAAPADEATDTAAVAVTEPRLRFAWSSVELDAAAWVRANLGRDSVLVTNETLSYLVPALTGLRTYISGAPLQSLYGSKETVGEIPDRVSLSMRVLAAPASADRLALCSSAVDYAWVANDLAPGADFAALGDVVFASDAVTIVQLDQGACQ